MKLNAYTLYDVKSLVYSPPFFAVAHGSAIRMVMDLANDPGTLPGRHPQDFTLLCIGSFDDQLGLVLPLDNREHVTDLLPLVSRPVPVPSGGWPSPTAGNGLDLTPGATDPALK